MNIYSNTNSPFPSQVVSDAEKASLEYGTQVAQAIEQEWFSQGRTSGNRYLTNWNNFHQLRLYARGEQSIRKYKDEFAINGDLSYLNLDWKPVPIIPKSTGFIVRLTFGAYLCLLQAIKAKPELIEASCVVLLFILNFAQSSSVL